MMKIFKEQHDVAQEEPPFGAAGFGEQQPRIALGLAAVLEATDELVRCNEEDTLLRRAVELAREKLGVERFAIFLDELGTGQMNGSYGTDLQGRTTDEHQFRIPAWDGPMSLPVSPIEGSERWVFKDKRFIEANNGHETEKIDRDWMVITPIFSTSGRIGVAYQDAAISKAPQNETLQDIVTIYCSMLGPLIESKRTAEAMRDNQRQTSEGLGIVLDMADELVLCEDFDTLMRRAVELCRDRLAIERLGIFLREGDNDFLSGTYGTDLQGHIIKETHLISRGIDALDMPKPASKSAFSRLRIYKRATAEEDHESDTDTRSHRDWVVTTPIQSSQGTIGVCYNDNGLTRSAIDESQQERLAVFCSMLGNMIESKRAAEAMRENQRSLALLMSNLPGMAYRCGLDASWTMEYISEGALELTGYAPEELIDNRRVAFGQLIHPDDRVVAWHQVQNALETRSAFQFTYRITAANGQQKWLSEQGRGVFSVGGELVALEGFISDITERKQAEDALRESEEGLRTLTESMPQLVWIARADGWHYYFNQQWTVYTGLTYQQSLGLESYNAIHPDDREKALSRWQQAVQTGQPYDQEFRLRRADGSYHWMLGRTLPLRDGSEQIVKWFGTCTDIDDQKQAQKALRETQEKLEIRVEQRTRDLIAATAQAKRAKEEAERANAAKSEFLSRTSHELRTPLNAILGFGQLLDAQKLPPGQSQSVSHILQAGRHLLQLINEVLDISLIDSKRPQVTPQSVAVSSTMREVLNLVQPLAETRGIRLVNLLPEGNRWHFFTDKQRFLQVLLNLLSNAIKYNRSGGTVTISAQIVENRTETQIETEIGNHKGEKPLLQGLEATNETALRLAVRDTGMGLSSEDIAKLFTPFERLGAAKAGIEGTGIGLTLTKSLIEAMGGTIGVQSVLTEGTTFWIELPLFVQNLPSSTPHFAANGELSGIHPAAPTHLSVLPEVRRKTVLCIEDNRANLHLIEAFFERRPQIRLQSAMKGQEGIDMALSHRPDLILLDLHLPDIDGSEVLRVLKNEASTQSIPVVILSADATPGQIRQMLSNGAQNYLTKPLDLKKLLQIVDETLQNN